MLFVCQLRNLLKKADHKRKNVFLVLVYKRILKMRNVHLAHLILTTYKRAS